MGRKRKVFISFLGTGLYEPVHYEFAGKCTPSRTRYIQEAILKLLYNDWTEADQVLIFCTEYAYKVNWLTSDRRNNITGEMEHNVGLGDVLDTYKHEGFAPIVKCVTPVAEGFSPDEVWEIFEIVLKELQPNDELYFDMTHAFRHIPFIGHALFNYAQEMYATELKEVHYGAYEKMRNDKTLTAAPIVDLKSVVQLQNMTLGFAYFKSFGKTKPLSDILIEKKHNYLKQKIASFETLVAGCRMLEIEEGLSIKELNELLDATLRKSLNAPTREILLAFKDKLVMFSTTSSLDNIHQAVLWAFETDMIQQAYTMGQELILTWLERAFAHKNTFEESESSSVDFRKIFSSLLSMRDQDIKNYTGKPWQENLFNEFWKTHLGVEKSEFEKLRLDYNKLTQFRNVINHGSEKRSFKEIKSNFENAYIKSNLFNRVKTLFPHVLS